MMKPNSLHITMVAHVDQLFKILRAVLNFVLCFGMVQRDAWFANASN